MSRGPKCDGVLTCGGLPSAVAQPILGNGSRASTSTTRVPPMPGRAVTRPQCSATTRPTTAASCPWSCARNAVNDALIHCGEPGWSMRGKEAQGLSPSLPQSLLQIPFPFGNGHRRRVGHPALL
jgi:hypothetical protein